MTADLRNALRTLALSSPAGAPVTFTLPREDLLALVDSRADPGPAAASAERLLTVPEAAARCAVSPRYIYTHADRLPFVVRIGRKVRISETRFTRWLERPS